MSNGPYRQQLSLLTEVTKGSGTCWITKEYFVPEVFEVSRKDADNASFFVFHYLIYIL